MQCVQLCGLVTISTLAITLILISFSSLAAGEAQTRMRRVERVIESMNTSDGAGVKLKRSIGTHQLDYIDPFLMLDEFKSEKGSDYIAGFPSHPHRGFETVTYMLHGKMQHKDNRGNQGVIESGGVQWMTAGRGIVHSEMPLQEDGLMWGFQLWVNLPAALKMTKPRYQDIPAADVPVIKFSTGTEIRVIAGEVKNEKNEIISGCVKDIVTKPLFLDVGLNDGQEFTYDIPEGLQGFVYCFEGEVEVEGKQIPAHHIGVLSDGSSITLKSVGTHSRALLLAATPLNEPVARRGPFVMNSSEEIMQAFFDFRSGNF